MMFVEVVRHQRRFPTTIEQHTRTQRLDGVKGQSLEQITNAFGDSFAAFLRIVIDELKDKRQEEELGVLFDQGSW